MSSTKMNTIPPSPPAPKPPRLLTTLIPSPVCRVSQSPSSSSSIPSIPTSSIPSSSHWPGAHRHVTFVLNDAVHVWGGHGVGGLLDPRFVWRLNHQEAMEMETTRSCCFPSSSSSLWTRILTRGAVPSGAIDAAAVVVAGAAFVFGGQNLFGYHDPPALQRFSAFTRRWKDVTPRDGATPRGRIGAVAWTDGVDVFFFGGRLGTRASPFQPSPPVMGLTNETLRFEFASSRWTEASSAGRRPPPRRHAGCAVVAKKAIVFGGKGAVGGGSDEGGSEGETYLDDLWCFDLETFTWTMIEVNFTVRPPPTDRCSLTPLTQQHLILVGGANVVGWSRCIWILDIATNTWKKYPSAVPDLRNGDKRTVDKTLNIKQVNDEAEDETEDVTGARPIYAHGAALNDGIVFLVGGLRVDALSDAVVAFEIGAKSTMPSEIGSGKNWIK